MEQPQDLISNTIHYSQPFDYDDVERRLLSHVTRSYIYEDERIQREVNEGIQEFLHRFLSVVIPSQNTRMQCVAFAFASGIDISYLFNCDNTLTSISKQLGCTKQSLSIAIKEVERTFNIRANTGISHDAKQNYIDSNIRPRQ